jgi:hypothetical protein
MEVDLQSLSVVSCESFPWSITALSAADAKVPLTVGTNLGIHLHDYRSRMSYEGDGSDRLDNLGELGANYFYKRGLKTLFDDNPLPPYAPLSQPGPLSILHLQRPGSEADLSDDIYVAGRFSSILHYDRRKFPHIKGSIHSGARLCSMTSLPYPFSPVDFETRLRGELSLDQIRKSKTLRDGRTLIACGEYNTKGSLELYGFAPPPPGVTGFRGSSMSNSVLKNRQTSSQSKLLSVTNHGCRIAVSDGSGYVKWFERDGFTEVRRCRLGHAYQHHYDSNYYSDAQRRRQQEQQYQRERQVEADVPSLFASMPGSDDIARKLVCVRPDRGDGEAANDNDLIFWTGEKLGLVGFSSRPAFLPADFEDGSRTMTPEEAEMAEAERLHTENIRRALERQADDVRLVRNLGLGSGWIQD